MARIRLSKAEALSLNARKASEAQLEAAFTALRDVFRKQVIRLGGGTESQQSYAKPFINAKGEFTYQTMAELRTERSKLPPDASKRNLMFSVMNLQELVTKPRYSLSGWKAIENRTVQSLQAHGYKNINKQNLKAFGNFMEKMRAAFGNKIFPSEEVAELFDAAGGELSDMDESEILGILDDLGADITGVDLFA